MGLHQQDEGLVAIQAAPEDEGLVPIPATPPAPAPYPGMQDLLQSATQTGASTQPGQAAKTQAAQAAPKPSDPQYETESAKLFRMTHPGAANMRVREGASLDAVRKDIVAPAVKYAADTYINTAKRMGLMSPADELFARSAASAFTGNSYLDEMSEKDRLDAVNAMDKSRFMGGVSTGLLGVTQAAAGVIPFLFVGGAGAVSSIEAAEPALATKAPILSKILGAAMEGGATGGALGFLNSDESVGESALSGAVVGAGLHTGAEAFTAAAPKVVAGAKKVLRTIGVVTRDGLDLVGRELRKLDANADYSFAFTGENAPLRVARDEVAPSVERRASVTQPSTAVIYEQDGKWFGRVTELRAGEEPKTAEIPLKTPQEVGAFHDEMQGHGIKPSFHTSGEAAASNFEMVDAATYGAKGKPTLVVGDRLADKTGAAQDAFRSQDETGAMRMPRVTPAKNEKVVDAFNNPDLPPGGSNHEPQVLVQDETGHIKFQDVVGKDNPKPPPSTVDERFADVARKVRIAFPEKSLLEELKLKKLTEKYGVNPPTPPAEAYGVPVSRRVPAFSDLPTHDLIPPGTLKDVASADGHVGAQVYLNEPVGLDKDGNPNLPLTAKVVKADPNAKGNFLVRLDERRDGPLVSVAADKLHIKTPPGIADNKELFHEVPPTAIPEPGQMSDSHIEAINNTAALAKSIVEKGPEYWKKVKDFFMPVYQQSSEVFNDWVRKGLASQKIASSQQYIDAFKKTLSTLPKEMQNMYSDAGSELASVAEGTMKWKDFRTKHPELGQKLDGLVPDFLNRIQHLHDELRSLGVVPEDLSWLKSGSGPQRYLARSYLAYTMPKGEWSEIAVKNPHNIVRNMAAWVSLQLKDTKLLFNENDITAQLMDVLKSDDPLNALRQRSFASPFRHLMARDETLPSVVRKFLGEETSGYLRIAYTLESQEIMLAQAKMWKGLTEVRQVDSLNRSFNPMWSPGLRADLHPVPIPNSIAYGAAAGGYIHPDLLPILNAKTAMGEGHLWADLARSVSNFRKGNLTVGGGSKPWLSNVVRNILGGALSGGYDPFRPLESELRYRQAIKLLHDWHNNPIPDGDKALVREAMDNGVDLTHGFVGLSGAGKSRWMLKQIRDSFTEGQTPGGVTSLLGKLRDIHDEARIKFSNVKDTMGAGYNWVDQVNKLAGYLAQREQGLKKGLSENEAARNAARRVQESFPDFSKPSKFEQASDILPGVFATFLKGTTQDIRIAGTLARRLAVAHQEEPELFARLAGLAMTMYGMKTASTMMARANGITREDEEAAAAKMSKGRQFYRKALVTIPWHDSNGQVQFWDITNWLPLGQMAQGSITDHPVARAAINLALTPFQDSLPEQKLREMIASAGGPVAPQATPALRPGEGSALNFLRTYGTSTGFVPGAIANAWQTADRVKQDNLTVGQAARGMLGGLPEAGSVTDKDAQANAMEMERLVGKHSKSGQLRKWLFQIPMDPHLDASEKQRQTDAAIKYISDEAKRQGDIGNKAEAARKSHLKK